MRILTLLFTLFFAFNALAVAPYGIKGQSQTGTLYSNVHQFPNNQVTDMGGINALVETGNKNILRNPSFEHLTLLSGWTRLGTVSSEAMETSVVIDGKKSYRVTLASQGLILYQDSTLYQAQFADGVQGLIMARIKTSIPGIYLCPRSNGQFSAFSKCVTHSGSGKWELLKVPVILGAVDNGLSIASYDSSGGFVNATGTVYVDDAFVGAVDLKQDVDQSRIAGAAYFAGTASCLWARTSTTMGPFTATAACPGPTIEQSSMGSWQTTDSDLPRVTINNLPAGKYKATFLVPFYMGAQVLANMAIFDGATTCQSVGASSSTINTTISISCIFDYISSGNRNFEIYASSSSSSTNIDNRLVTVPSQTKFILEYFGSGSVYSSTNADTGWTDCGHTASDFIGFGTVASIQTQCKRSGDELLMRGRFTATTAPTATEARVALKLSGTTLTSKNSTSIATVQHIGDYYRSGAATSHGGAVLIEPSVGYVTFTDSGVFSNATVGAITKANGSSIIGAGESISINARIPINDWDNSNIIIGQFNEVVTAPGVSKPKTCYYAFGGASATLAAPTECTTGTCVEVVDTCGTATPPTRSSLGTYASITFSAGTFANSSAIKCECSGFDSVSGNGRYCAPYFTTGGQSWASSSSGGYLINVFTSTPSATLDDTYVFLKCEGQAP